MEWRAELESTCAALGTSDGINYFKDEECLECVKDLIRFLRRDDSSHVLRRSLGQIGVVQSDLIPLLRDYSDEEELFDLVLRLLVNLTGPELLLFREELPEDKVTRNHYIELQTFRQAYKRAFVDEKLWAVLTQTLGKLLRKDYSERSEEDGLVIERILILVRNILQVPRDTLGERRTDDEASIHDQVLWVLHKSGMEDLLLYVASSSEETQYCLHVLEIISLMFREQDPKHLASADFQRSKEEKRQDEMELLRLREKEMEEQKQKFHQVKSARHSRFGGTFTVANVKSISEKSLIYHRPLTSMNNLNFDKEKRPKKVAKNRRMPDDPEAGKRRSTLAIRLFLKEFCVEFLHGAYNNLMSVVKDSLVRHKAQNNDETYYLWAMKFFMEFNRENKFRPDLVIETLAKSSFHFVQNQIENYKDNYEHEKKNRPMCLIWGRRMHLAVRAYQELLLNLVAMVSSKDPKVRDSGMVLRADVFYEPEYRELCLNQLALYQPEKMSLSHLKDLVETTHVFLKLMEHMSKSSHIMVSSKKVKKKSSKSVTKSKSSLNKDGFVNQREASEQKWDEISSELSRLLQNTKEDLPDVGAPFDAASQVPIDDQKVHALFKIQNALKTSQPEIAIALLRASREVWPENDSFGAADAEPEDEFMAMREILFADIPTPSDMKEEQADENDEEANNILEKQEIEEDDDEEEEEIVTTSRVEQEFDFNTFVQRFAVKSVCASYSILLANFDKNTDHVNHCIIKMFHRIAFDLKLPGLLFHFSILRSFQKIHREYRLNPSNASMRDLNRFAKYLLQLFFELSHKNPLIWMETCFWKTSREASEIEHGYGTQAATKKQKASYWCEEDEEKLTRVFHQIKEMNLDKPRNADENAADMLDDITAFFQDSNKSRRQVVRKLKEMGLIKDAKEVTKKPLKSRAPKNWSDEEIEKLKALYAEFKDAMDPVNRIMEQMVIKRSKKRVVDKIMELGLCDDKKKLSKKRVRRGLKEGDPGYLESASESDSALEDSSSGDESEVEAEKEISVDKLKEIASAVLGDQALKPALEWLKARIDDEKEDRGMDSDEPEDVPIVPITDECISAVEQSSFADLMRSLQIIAPSHQERYWRIPASLSETALAAKSKFLVKLLENDLDFADLDLSQVAREVVKQKKEKRGPNKWMPIRRPVNQELMESNCEKTQKGNPTPKGKSTPKRRRAVLQDDSSSDEDQESKEPDVEDKETISLPSRDRLLSGSDTSDDGVDDPLPTRRLPSDDDTSDDGVDDPWPIKRLPSDTDHDNSAAMTTVNEVTMDTSQANTTRPTSRSSTSSSSSSRSSSRSRSVTKSPVRSSSYLLSSASNTPKRPLSSPSPIKKDKKAKILDGSDSSEDEGMCPKPSNLRSKRILSSDDDE